MKTKDEKDEIESKTEQKDKIKAIKEQQHQANFKNRIVALENRFEIKINFVR